MIDLRTFESLGGADHGFAPWRKAFQGLVSEGRLGPEKVALLKPETFMNLSGQSVQAAVAFWKLPLADMTVFHDELDLAPGKVRVKDGGGHAGHNGLRSLHQHVGDAYLRVRIGVGHPGHKDRVSAYVLSDFAKADRDWLVRLLDAIADNAGELTKAADNTFANRVHLITEPKAERKPKAEPATDKTAPAAAAPAEPPPRNAMAAVLRSLLAQKTRR